MIRIVTSKDPARNLKGTSKTGRAYDLNFQTAYAQLVDENGETGEFPERFEFVLAAGQQVQPKAHYTLHPSSLVVKDGRLTIGDVRLVPFTPATK